MTSPNAPRWPDGTVRSTNNAFHFKDGRRSIFLGTPGFTGKTGPKSEEKVLEARHGGTFARAGVA